MVFADKVQWLVTTGFLLVLDVIVICSGSLVLTRKENYPNGFKSVLYCLLINNNMLVKDSVDRSISKTQCVICQWMKQCRQD